MPLMESKRAKSVTQMAKKPFDASDPSTWAYPPGHRSCEWCRIWFAPSERNRTAEGLRCDACLPRNPVAWWRHVLAEWVVVPFYVIGFLGILFGGYLTYEYIFGWLAPVWPKIGNKGALFLCFFLCLGGHFLTIWLDDVLVPGRRKR